MYYQGFGSEEFKLIGDLIYKVINGLSKNKEDNSKIEKKFKKKLFNCALLILYMENN